MHGCRISFMAPARPQVNGMKAFRVDPHLGMSEDEVRGA
jgi:hypothetical protein